MEDEAADEWKVCIRGFERLAREGCGVGRWVVVRPREDWGNVSIFGTKSLTMTLVFDERGGNRDARE